jgi:hypothetical protein
MNAACDTEQFGSARGGNTGADHVPLPSFFLSCRCHADGRSVRARHQGTFTATRVLADTTTNVLIPVQPNAIAYPTAGTIVRSMKVTLTYEGQTPLTSERREVITFNGSSTATVVITKDGETRNCTLPLPRGRLVCE